MDVFLARHLFETVEKELEISQLIEKMEIEKAIANQKDLLYALKSLNIPDKDGLLKDKINYLEKSQERLNSGAYNMSSKFYRYSSYFTSFSKKRQQK